MATWFLIALLAAALFLSFGSGATVLGGLPTGGLNEEQEFLVLMSHRFALRGKPNALVRSRAVPPFLSTQTFGPPRRAIGPPPRLL